MILQSLYNYYDRLAERKQISDIGFSMEKVGFVIEIDNDGNLVQDIDIRQGHGNKCTSSARMAQKKLIFKRAFSAQQRSFYY